MKVVMDDRLYAGKNTVHPGYPVNGSMLLACWLPLLGVYLKTVAAQSAAGVLIIPESINLAFGETASVDLQFHSVSNIYGFELHLQFVPTIIHAVDSDPDETGIQVQHGDLYPVSEGSLAANQVDKPAWTNWFCLHTSCAISPYVWRWRFGFFRASGIAAGSSQIELERVILASPDGELLPFKGTCGVVNINALAASMTLGSATEISTDSLLPFPTQTPEPIKLSSRYLLPQTPRLLQSMWSRQPWIPLIQIRFNAEHLNDLTGLGAYPIPIWWNHHLEAHFSPPVNKACR